MRNIPMRYFILLVLVRGEPVDGNLSIIRKSDESFTTEFGDFGAEATVIALGPVDVVAHAHSIMK